MLHIVGGGPFDEKDMTLRAKEVIERCDEVFVESYTSFWNGRKQIAEMLDIEIEELYRDDLEDNLDNLLEKAKDSDIAVIFPGDPMVATTHAEILIEAKKKGIKTNIVHAPSIYSIVAETGLQIYKFGKTTTLPYTEKNYFPTSPYETIENNLEMGLHTLALLDIKDDKMMSIKEAIDYLKRCENKLDSNKVTADRKLVGYHYGGDESKVIYDTADELINKKINVPSVLIIPADLHDKEKETLQIISE